MLTHYNIEKISIGKDFSVYRVLATYLKDKNVY